MATAWFLDLDGAKSGPYQTQEVLSLVAEGEILPHHLIGPNLKEGPWISVLEWRLNLAKVVPEPQQPTPAPEPAQNKPVSSVRETKIELQEPEKAQPKPLPSLPHVPSPSLTSQPNYKPELPPIAVPTPIHSPLNPPSPYIPTAHEDAKPSKRDPMAEMFDVLQRSKQKREEKQILTAQTQHAAAELSRPPKAESNNPTFWKTALMGIGITIAGFWLGQWFQKSAPPKDGTASQTAAQTVPTAAPQSTPESAPVAQNDMREEHVLEDRSTDKIQIRGKVAPKPVISGNALAPPGQPTGGNPEPETLNAAKDLKELQDLKKELQELKNLKDELKNSIHDDGFQPDGEMDIDPQNPDAAGGGEGKPLINPDIHY